MNGYLQCLNTKAHHPNVFIEYFLETRLKRNSKGRRLRQVQTKDSSQE